MIYREYEERAKAVRDYFAPGKEVKLARVTVTMMSIDNRDAPLEEEDDMLITPEQLPIIECVYADSNGCLMEVCIEWPDLEALEVMNNETPLEKPPTVEYVDRG